MSAEGVNGGRVLGEKKEKKAAQRQKNNGPMDKNIPTSSNICPRWACIYSSEEPHNANKRYSDSKTHPVPSGVRRGVPARGQGGAATATGTTAHRTTEAERRARRQGGGGGLGGGGRAGVVRDGSRAVAGALGRADAVLGAAAGAAAGAAGRPPRGEIDHVVEPVRRAEPGTAALLTVPRPLEAPGLSAAGVLHGRRRRRRRFFFSFKNQDRKGRKGGRRGWKRRGKNTEQYKKRSCKTRRRRTRGGGVEGGGVARA